LPRPNGGGGGGPQALRSYEPAPRVEAAPVPVAAPQAFASPRSYLDLVALAGEKRDVLLKISLETHMRPVSFREQSIEVALLPGADPGVIQTLSKKLKEWTGQVWGVSVSRNAPAGPTMRDIKDQHLASIDAEAQKDPLVKAIMDMFPGSTLRVKTREEQVPDALYEDAFMERDDMEDE
jgi:DNA polymerase-3 subunit gamma/tau